jgi:site-specific DNA-methyltransferase (adenine-specific)
MTDESPGNSGIVARTAKRRYYLTSCRHGHCPSHTAHKAIAAPGALRQSARSMSPRRFSLAQLDAVGWLQSLDAESLDLVITDPPYESLEKHRAVGTTTRLKKSKASSNEWFQIFPNSRFEELFSAVYRVLKRNSHFYLFCDQETMFVAKPLAERAGFKFWKPLVWDKEKIGMGYHYRARYEFILFFEKGKRRLHDLGVADVISAPRVFNGYPTEKPVAVSEILIKQSTEPGAIVADPFAGSSSTGVAALRNDRIFLGNDLSLMALETSRARLLEEGGVETPMFLDGEGRESVRPQLLLAL